LSPVDADLPPGPTPAGRTPAAAALSSAVLDLDGLEAALRPFGQSTMLPQAAYTSEAVLAWERRHVFAGSWTCLGRTADLRGLGTHRPPTYRSVTVGDVGVLLTFASDGNGDATGDNDGEHTVGADAADATVGANADFTVRALANTCRHRAHELLPAGVSGDHRALVCPYHGWSYDLDGTLRAAPRLAADLDRRGYGLAQLPAVDWHGWLFVNATGTAGSFAEHLGTLERHVGAYRPERLTVKARHMYEVAANWKIIVENYHECYHCPLIHPELCAVTPPTSGVNWHEPGAWVGGSMALREHAQTMALDGVSHGVALPGVDPRTVGYLGLFPNLLLSLHPDYVMTHRLEPLAPGRTRVECEWIFPAEVADPSYAVRFWDLTNRQDWRACESVQRGVASPHFRPGPLAPDESAVYDWVSMVARAYRALAPARAAGQAG
jgi:Rieske 2Fe-2S family protein